MKRTSTDIVGQRFGMLVVKELVVPKPYMKKSWLCQCDCGNTCIRLEATLKSSKRDGRVSNCGCVTKQNLTVGDSKRCSKAGLHRKDSFVKGCNVQMTFRDGTISTNTSGVQGVSWEKRLNKWHVYIGYQNYRANLGYYADLEEAKKIRELAEDALKKNLFEEFYYEIRGKRIEEVNIKQFKKRKHVNED